MVILEGVSKKKAKSMVRLNINPILEKIKSLLERHKVAVGQYSRWIGRDDAGKPVLRVDEYGCADAANILYTLNSFPKDPKRLNTEREYM